jgi:hypothetical protein
MRRGSPHRKAVQGIYALLRRAPILDFKLQVFNVVREKET